MRIVLDTNVLLVIVGSNSSLHHVFQRLMDGTIELCVTTEILLEYQEILSRHLGQFKTELILDAVMAFPRLNLVENYIHWNLIEVDPDDNKFVDCAIISGARYVVSDDSHFNILKTIPFPKVDVIRSIEFGKETKSL